MRTHTLAFVFSRKVVSVVGPETACEEGARQTSLLLADHELK
jgi:hypothetical protein